MKQQLTILIFFIYLALPSFAQTVTPNLRINDVNNAEASLDATRSLATVGDTVYVVFSDERNGGVSNVFFCKSVNGGTTFSTPVNINPTQTTTIQLWPSIAVNSSGMIFIAWVAVNGPTTENYNIWFTNSSNGGTSFAAPTIITNTHSFVYPSVGTYNNNVYILYTDAVNYPCVDYYFISSTNAGLNFSVPTKMNDVACSGTIKFEGVNNMHVDAMGNIYLVWIDGRRANGSGDIFFSKSTNNGLSFSTDVMVNDVASAGADSIQYLPRVTSGSGNMVYVSFTDMRLGRADWGNNRAYLSVSSDGGSSFATEALIANHNGTCKYFDMAGLPNNKIGVLANLNNVNTGEWGIWYTESTDNCQNFSTFLGVSDTMNIDHSEPCLAFSPNNNAYTLWRDDREGDMNIYFSRIDFPVTNTFEKGRQYDNFSIYPNPSYGNIQISTDSKKDFEVDLLNLNGQIISHKSFNNTNLIDFKTEVPSGVYFIKITSGNSIETLKYVKY